MSFYKISSAAPAFAAGGISSVVAVPVCNERDHIAACLTALLAQHGGSSDRFGILLFLNNCTDGTREVVDAIAGNATVAICVIEENNSRASAGWARRRAMDAAAAWLEAAGQDDGVILTSDADSRVPPDWVMRNQRAISEGAHAVAGRICLDANDAERLPASLHARGALEEAYEALLTEIGARLDPDPHNLWPTHWSQSGATIAVRLSTYRLIGGVPDLPLGEDRALIDAIKARDLPVRYDPDIIVTTSGRLEGRAAGGCADTMRLRCEQPNAPCDDRLERLDRAVLRTLMRRHLRSRYRQQRLATTLLGRLLSIPKHLLAQSAALPHFGQAFACIQAASPKLHFRPIRPRALALQIMLAKTLVSILRLRGAQWPVTPLDDISASAAVVSPAPIAPMRP